MHVMYKHILTHSLQIKLIWLKQNGSLFVSAVHTPPQKYTHTHPPSFTHLHSIQMHFNRNSVNMKSSMNMRGDLLVFNITMHTSTTLIQTNTLHSLYTHYTCNIKHLVAMKIILRNKLISAIEITFYLFWLVRQCVIWNSSQYKHQHQHWQQKL